MALPEDLLMAIRRYLSGTASPADLQRVTDWYQSFSDEEIDIPAEDLALRERIKARIGTRLQDTLQIQLEGGEGKTDAPVVPLWKRGIRVASVAAVLLLLAGGGYWYGHRTPEPAIASLTPTAPTNDVAPGGNKAILYLANGSAIVLDSAHKGQLARLGNTTVTKTDSGKLLYASTGKMDVSVNGLNILVTPRGGIYQVVLPDGTGAWLNAASSITYPTRFDKKEREVSITGEVYFEVAKDPAHPFIVSLPAKTRDQGENGHWMQVEVLGTSFDVNSYQDTVNDLARTTLLEGSIKVMAHGQSKLIRPGEQAATGFAGSAIAVTGKIDLDKVMAWKNGEMVLTNSSVERIMREISRWYDVDIRYRGDPPHKQFYGSIDRNVPLSSVLKALQAYGVETTLEQKTIIVQ
jgi:transmembrane sensor